MAFSPEGVTMSPQVCAAAKVAMKFTLRQCLFAASDRDCQILESSFKLLQSESWDYHNPTPVTDKKMETGTHRKILFPKQPTTNYMI